MTRNPPPIDLSESPAIEVRGAHKHYGALHAVDGIDLRIARGEIFGLIGHNGAGKSTLFKMILGLTPATSGEIRVGGATVQGRDFRAARRHLGYLPENVVLYDNLNGLETLRFFARLKGAPLAQCPALLERVGLAHAGKRPVREYSKGMRQRLGLAQPDPALIGNAGSFFKNPTVTPEQCADIIARDPKLVHYPMPDGSVKLAAGWLIDACGWRGKSVGNAAVYEKQALVLVNRGGREQPCTGGEVMTLAKAIQTSVYERFGILLEPEPVVV